MTLIGKDLNEIKTRFWVLKLVETVFSKNFYQHWVMYFCSNYRQTLYYVSKLNLFLSQAINLDCTKLCSLNCSTLPRFGKCAFIPTWNYSLSKPCINKWTKLAYTWTQIIFLPVFLQLVSSVFTAKTAGVVKEGIFSRCTPKLLLLKLRLDILLDTNNLCIYRLLINPNTQLVMFFVCFCELQVLNLKIRSHCTISQSYYFWGSVNTYLFIFVSFDIVMFIYDLWINENIPKFLWTHLSEY